MRKMLCLAFAFGFVAVAAAQMPNWGAVRRVEAKTLTQPQANFYQLRGDVKIELMAVKELTVSADEADFDGGAREFTLRGNVRTSRAALVSANAVTEGSSAFGGVGAFTIRKAVFRTDTFELMADQAQSAANSDDVGLSGTVRLKLAQRPATK